MTDPRPAVADYVLALFTARLADERGLTQDEAVAWVTERLDRPKVQAAIRDTIRDYQEHGVGGPDDPAEMQRLFDRIERAVTD